MMWVIGGALLIIVVVVMQMGSKRKTPSQSNEATANNSVAHPTSQTHIGSSSVQEDEEVPRFTIEDYEGILDKIYDPACDVMPKILVRLAVRYGITEEKAKESASRYSPLDPYLVGELSYENLEISDGPSAEYFILPSNKLLVLVRDYAEDQPEGFVMKEWTPVGAFEQGEKLLDEKIAEGWDDEDFKAQVKLSPWDIEDWDEAENFDDPVHRSGKAALLEALTARSSHKE